MPSILPERPSVPQLKARIFKASNGCGSGFVAAGVMARGATQKQALLQCCFGPAPRLVSSKPVSPLQQHTTTKSGSCYTLPRQHYHYPFPSSLSRNLSQFRISTPPHGTMSYLSGSLVCRDVPAAAYWARSAQNLEKVRENLLNF